MGTFHKSRSFLLLIVSFVIVNSFSVVISDQAKATTATYSSAFTNGVAATTAQASQWRSFLLSLTGTYSRITISSSTGASISVTDATIVPNIATALRTSAASSTGSTTYTIGVNKVVIGSCGSDLEISIGASVTLCNCIASGAYTVRPGIGADNPNWGGANNQTCSNGNNGVSQTLTVSFSVDAPTASTFSTSQSSPTNISLATTTTYSLVMSQSITGLASADFQFGGTSTCNPPGVSGSGTTYSITVTNCTEGNLILQLKANSVTGTTTTGPSAVASANTIVIDRTAPTISSVTGPANATYKPTQALTFSVATSETVTVTGTPRLALTIGSTTRYANYASGSNTRTLLFTYTVATSLNDIDSDGIAVSTTLDLNSGTIVDLASNAMSSLTFSAPTLTSVLVAQPPAAPTFGQR